MSNKKFSEDLTHRVLRRSFATILYVLEIPHLALCYVLNHGSVAAVESYVVQMLEHDVQFVMDNKQFFLNMVPYINEKASDKTFKVLCNPSEPKQFQLRNKKVSPGELEESGLMMPMDDSVDDSFVDDPVQTDADLNAPKKQKFSGEEPVPASKRKVQTSIANWLLIKPKAADSDEESVLSMTESEDSVKNVEAEA